MIRLPEAETEQPDDFDPVLARKAWIAIGCIAVAFWGAVGVAVWRAVA